VGWEELNAMYLSCSRWSYVLQEYQFNLNVSVNTPLQYISKPCIPLRTFPRRPGGAGRAGRGVTRDGGRGGGRGQEGRCPGAGPPANFQRHRFMMPGCDFKHCLLVYWPRTDWCLALIDTCNHAINHLLTCTFGGWPRTAVDHPKASHSRKVQLS
jgi:hypothetical protein